MNPLLINPIEKSLLQVNNIIADENLEDKIKKE